LLPEKLKPTDASKNCKGSGSRNFKPKTAILIPQIVGRANAIIFLSGNGGLLEFRDGNLRCAHSLIATAGVFCFVRVTRFRELVIPVQYQERGMLVLFRSYFLHYRAIRETVTAAVTIGTAVLFSYLILQARF